MRSLTTPMTAFPPGSRNRLVERREIDDAKKRFVLLFHAHKNEFAEKGWLGFFEVHE
ncbi:hypothetical protein LCGC14_3139490 [marine sediment metagenome]|uniref:Uncharacterized protein n=1 Tax=marine sediment metagenome TaxID=412755 RepID=A0A0F8VXE9_9ZZZZ